jgi:dolichyl-phosphate beta-glucosyltransferase
MIAEVRALLVIPCFRESDRIVPFLASLHEMLADAKWVSVLVVDDGSGGEEQSRMMAIVDGMRVIWPALRPLLRLETNQGKGGAVYAGWAASEGEELLAFVDADGSCAADSVNLLLHLARDQDGEVAMFGSRIKMLGCDVQRDWRRHLLGRVFATLVGETLKIPVYDSQCGLKVLPRAMFERVQPLLELKGFAFDVELITALWDTDCPMREVPIHWSETPGGKVRLLRDSWRMLRDVMKIRQRRRSTAWLAALKS